MGSERFGLWTGCFGTYEERVKKVVSTLERVLDILGTSLEKIEGVCCGDPLRQIGDIPGFQTKVQENMRLIQGYDVKKIVTICPHCFHVLRREYTRYDESVQAVHHVVLLSHMLNHRIPKGEMRAVTFHDPCFLGRWNNVYEEPREVLRMLGMKIVEMGRSRERSLCCGGGGGRMWSSRQGERPVEAMRFEEALRTGAEALVTACPYCLVRFDSVAKGGYDRRISILDVVEAVGECLCGS